MLQIDLLLINLLKLGFAYANIYFSRVHAIIQQTNAVISRTQTHALDEFTPLSIFHRPFSWTQRRGKYTGDSRNETWTAKATHITHF